MITLTAQCRDDAERLALGPALAFVRRPRPRAAGAAGGAALPARERAAPRGGRALPRDALAAALRGRIEAAEQKGPPAPAPARAPGGTRAGTRAPP